MFPYENLEVYKKAFLVNSEVYRFIKGSPLIPEYMKNQLGRAAFSVKLNISEGSGKFSTKDRRNFYVIARASCFECASIVSFLYHEGELSAERKASWSKSFEEISKTLYWMIKRLDS